MLGWYALALGLFGCGRLGFDSHVDVSGDAQPAGDGMASHACGTRPVPDPVTVRGSTFRYTSFQNDTAPLDGVAVVATRRDGSVIVATTSDATGAYSLAIPTGGTAGEVVMKYSDALYFTTRVFLDAPLDRDILGPEVAVWQPGDAPLWNAAAMDSIYSSAGATRDPTRSTLNIAVRRCDGLPIEGVTVTIDPPPDTYRVTGANGAPDPSPTTLLPYATVLGLNAQPVSTRISATAPGMTFDDVMVDVDVNQFNTLTIIHAVD